MPMLMKIEIMNCQAMLVRTRLNQKSCGESTLQVTIVQYAHQYGPNARLMNVNCSNGLWLHQAMKNSIA